ncbi:MAG: hydrogenase small subunit [Planctomycetes bacterium]|nr:hydrogenase small subunit [Planctomycetota bacterium]
MSVTRRDFLKYCTASAAALGISAAEVRALAKALLNGGGPTVLWLQGSSCSGCSVSFLNHVASTTPHDAADVLINVINLAYHPTLMAAAGDTAVAAAAAASLAPGHILVVEGGIPTAFAGNACWAWSENGADVTFQQAVTTHAQAAAAIVCVGQCSAYGGIPAAPPNPTAVQSVKQLTGLPTINVAGCPPHPDWMVWTIAKLVAGAQIPLDSFGRPTELYAKRVHDQCPRKEKDEEAESFGEHGGCLEELGCRGPWSQTKGNCPKVKFNDKANWCIGADAPCQGCTNPGFPGTEPFFHEEGEDGDD